MRLGSFWLRLERQSSNVHFPLARNRYIGQKQIQAETSYEQGEATNFLVLFKERVRLGSVPIRDLVYDQAGTKGYFSHGRVSNLHGS